MGVTALFSWVISIDFWSMKAWAIPYLSILLMEYPDESLHRWWR